MIHIAAVRSNRRQTERDLTTEINTMSHHHALSQLNAGLFRIGSSDSIGPFTMNVATPDKIELGQTHSIFLRLSRLMELLDQQDFSNYWRSGLNLLCQELAAEAASFRLLEPHSKLPEDVLRIGLLLPDAASFLDDWEHSLLEASWSNTANAHSDSINLAMTTYENFQILSIPIVVEQVVRGCVSFLLKETQSLTPIQCETLDGLVQMFAGNALRTQYLQATRKRLEQTNLLYQISQAITSSLDLTTVFHQTTELAASMLQAQAATLFSIDPKRRELVFMIAKGAAAHALEEKRIPMDRGVAGWVATHGQPLIVNNTLDNKLFNSNVDSQTGFVTRNIVCVPLQIQDRTVGVLEVLNKETSAGFSAADADWLKQMGQQIAIALENAQLYQNLRVEQDRIIKAQEDVRNHLARELHDNTAQMLSLIIMNLELTRQMGKKKEWDKIDEMLGGIEEYARQANREIRTLLFELRPIILESRGLIPALHAYHRQLQSSLDCDIHLKAPPLRFAITLQGANAIFSIIQEAVNNIRKHAQANHIWMRVSTDAEYLRFEVEDDGLGFDTEKIESHYGETGSFGLLNMLERASLLMGRLEVQSPRKHALRGTLITGFIPLSSIIASQET